MNKQLTLGELIDKVETFDRSLSVYYDFADLIPGAPHSYRGYYDQLSLDISTSSINLPVGDFLAILHLCVGREFNGWKGGKYRMTRETPVWVSRMGWSSSTFITDVVYGGYACMLVTCREDDEKI